MNIKPMKYLYSYIPLKAAHLTIIVMIISLPVIASPTNVLEKEVSVTLLDQPMQDVLKSLESAADIRFMYSPNHVDIEEVVSLQAKKRKLRDVLEELFLPRKIRYRVHEGTNTITLNKETVPNEKLPEKKSQPEENQRQRVNGKITDAASGMPMAG